MAGVIHKLQADILVCGDETVNSYEPNLRILHLIQANSGA
jgi:hypothetical protein